jgi:NADPH2:quinone reductase
MKAICITPEKGPHQEETPQPQKAAPGHLLIKMTASAINPGDKTFINRPLPPGSVTSLYNIYGASGAGQVIGIGEDVPEAFKNSNVTIYRSLHYSDKMVGAWSQYAHMHWLDCVILPPGENPKDYSGSLVNIITPYAFRQQTVAEGHKGILSTAGNSATGIAMIGMSIAWQFPLISIARNQQSKQKLQALGATHVLAADDPDFIPQLKTMSVALETTAIFDGVGGSILNKLIDPMPINSTIYSYGYLGDDTPFTAHTRTLSTKNISFRPFANIRTQTVTNPQNLENALAAIGKIIHMPHFKTKTGKTFNLASITEALAFDDNTGAKAVLDPFLP